MAMETPPVARPVVAVGGSGAGFAPPPRGAAPAASAAGAGATGVGAGAAPGARVAMRDSDPFFAIKDAMEAGLPRLRQQFEEWRAALATANTATDIAFLRQHEALEKALRKQEEMIGKLRGAVGIVESNRARFPHVDDRDLAARKAAVAQLERSIYSIRDIFVSKETRARFDADRKRELTASAAADAKVEPRDTAYTRAHTDFVRDRTAQMTVLRRDQDHALDSMMPTLDRLGDMAKVMGDEITDQGHMMDTIGGDMAATQSKMDSAIGQVEKMLKTKDKCQLITIVSLVVVFIIVAIVAFYMLT